MPRRQPGSGAWARQANGPRFKPAILSSALGRVQRSHVSRRPARVCPLLWPGYHPQEAVPWHRPPWQGEGACAPGLESVTLGSASLSWRGGPTGWPQPEAGTSGGPGPFAVSRRPVIRTSQGTPTPRPAAAAFTRKEFHLRTLGVNSLGGSVACRQILSCGLVARTAAARCPQPAAGPASLPLISEGQRDRGRRRSARPWVASHTMHSST